jgi:hypothetical protein
MKTLVEELGEAFDDLKDYSLILITIFFCMICLGFVFFHIGYSTSQRDAIKTGHAFWASDKDGNPEFRWKEQQFIEATKF